MIKDQRTFESRLQFLSSIFANLYSQEQILASCIEFKLKNQRNNYIYNLQTSVNRLTQSNPVSILNKLTRQE